MLPEKTQNKTFSETTALVCGIIKRVTTTQDMSTDFIDMLEKQNAIEVLSAFTNEFYKAWREREK